MSHNNVCAKTIEEHTQAELVLLGIEARKSNNQVLLRCFDNLPTMAELVDTKTQSELKAVQDNAVVATAPETKATKAVK